MRAIRIHEFGAPEVMRLEDVPDPKPGPGELVVNIRAIGVNPVETYIRAGLFYARELPLTPGSDAAGTVESAGEGVLKFKPGDRVYTAGTVTGAYAGKALCKEAQVHPLPDKLNFEEGACIGVPYATAYRALFHRAKAAPGETVLVHGATGGAGIAAVQLARASGMRVIGTGGTQKGRELILREGAHFALDHHNAGHLDEAAGLSEGGVDVIIEFLANVNLGNDLKALAKHGRVIVVGSRGPVEIDPRDMIGRDADIRGMSLFNAAPEELKSIHSALIAGFENETLKPVVGKELALGEAARAHHEIIELAAYGKIVLKP
ncbi:MAG: NADPH:quinone reductase [Deltaproteobacteria bacterium]|nr:NADPH:quinone reductase [Deltaproteobacteria bacterium]